MKYEDRNLTKIDDLVEHLRASDDGSIYWFRGQAKSSWSLIPSLGRSADLLAAEMTIFKKFRQNAYSHLIEKPKDDWEWIFLMQHHRAPTRLLDWSEIPLVALHFAISGHDDEDGALWVLDPVALNNLGGHHRAHKRDILAVGMDKELEQFLPDQVSARVARPTPVAFIGPKNSQRMVAQSGTFTVMHAEPVPIETIGDKKHLFKLVIPSDRKEALRKELKLLGVNNYTLFPDLDHVAEIARSLA